MWLRPGHALSQPGGPTCRWCVVQHRTPLWLSHHWPEDYDRCVRIGRRHLCRRCLAFYPVWLVAVVAALAGLRWPVAWDSWILWLLPVPVVAEWWLEHLGVLGYSATRNVVTSVICAIGVGVAFSRYLLDPGDPLFWAGVVVFAVLCAVPLVISRRGAATTPRCGASPSAGPGPRSASPPGQAPPRR